MFSRSHPSLLKKAIYLLIKIYCTQMEKVVHYFCVHPTKTIGTNLRKISLLIRLNPLRRKFQILYSFHNFSFKYCNFFNKKLILSIKRFFKCILYRFLIFFVFFLMQNKKKIYTQ